MRTKLLRSGTYQVVRIPRELDFDPSIDHLEIERGGDALVVRPIEATPRQSLGNVLEKFRAFSPDFMRQER